MEKVNGNRDENFFKISKPVTEKIKATIEKLKVENQRTGFVKKLDDKIGYPVWDKMVITKKRQRSGRNLSGNFDEPENLIIPLTVNDKSLSSLLIMEEINTGEYNENNYTTNDFLYDKVHEANADKPKMIELFTLFFYMENKTFGKKIFFNIPAKYFDQSTILDQKGEKVIMIKDIDSSLASYYNNTICITYACPWCYGNDPECPLGGTWEECTTISGGGGGYGSNPFVGGTDPGGNGGDPIGGGGGGGAAGDPPGGNGGGTGNNGALPPCPGSAWYSRFALPGQNDGILDCDPNAIDDHTGSVAFERNPYLTDYDPDIYWWNDIATSFPPQTLPSWANIDANYPKDVNNCDLPGPDVYALVGGPIFALYNSSPEKYANACALRVSRALNYSGVIIPNIPGHTYKGGDGKYYFLSSAKLYNWMKKTFGEGDIILKESDGGANGSLFQSKLSGNKGIYLMQANYPSKFGALGHASIFDGNACPRTHNCTENGEYFDAEGGVNKITLWKLQ